MRTNYELEEGILNNLFSEEASEEGNEQPE